MQATKGGVGRARVNIVIVIVSYRIVIEQHRKQEQRTTCWGSFFATVCFPISNFSPHNTPLQQPLSDSLITMVPKD